MPVIQSVLVPSIYQLAEAAEVQGKALEEDEQAIGQLTDQEMQKSLDELAARGWLSYRGPRGEIFHQKYLRRSMLKLMIARDPQKAVAIHQSAIKYFITDDSQEFQAEVLYHQLMLLSDVNNEVSFSTRRIKELIAHIKNNAEDLPERAAVLIQFAETGEVSRDQLSSLPASLYKEASLSTIKKYSKRREYIAAVQLIKETPSSRDSIDASLEPMFKTVEWHWIKTSIPEATKRENVAQMLDDIFYKSFADESQIFKDVASYFKMILKTYAIQHWRKGMDRNVVSRIAHLSTLYGNQIGKLKSDHSALITEFALVNIKHKSKDTSPARQNGINLLRLLSTELDSIVTFTPALVKIDPKWILSITRFLRRSTVALDTIFKLISTDPALSIKSILTGIDALSRNKIKSTFNAPIRNNETPRATTIKLLRGPDPEFRDLCKYALLEIFRDSSHYSELASHIVHVLPLRVSDFGPKNIAVQDHKHTPFFLAMMRSPESTLEAYIEFVDRAWSLGSLMKRILKSHPQAKKLKDVYERYLAWDKAVKGVLSNAYNIDLRRDAAPTPKKTNAHKPKKTVTKKGLSGTKSKARKSIKKKK